jgi:4-aminobutyrate aminotransferase-like enzyme
MVGLTLADGIDAALVRDLALERGLVVNSPGPRMIRLLPPLTISVTELDVGAERLSESIQAAAGEIDSVA